MLPTEKVSVVVPLYNCGSFIHECLTSIINQDYDDIEILVINDSSTDNSLKIVQSIAKEHFNVRIINSPVNQGLCKTRNTGIIEASGEYIVCVDADDVIAPYAINHLMNAIQYDEDVSFAFGGTVVIDSQSCLVEVRDFDPLLPLDTKPITANYFTTGNLVGHGSGVIFRKNKALKIGMYDEEMRTLSNEVSSDWDFYLNLANNGSYKFVPEYLVAYRIHSDGMSQKSTLAIFKSCVYVIEKNRCGKRHARSAKTPCIENIEMPRYFLGQALSNKEFHSVLVITVSMLRMGEIRTTFNVYTLAIFRKIQRYLLGCTPTRSKDIPVEREKMALSEYWNSR